MIRILVFALSLLWGTQALAQSGCAPLYYGNVLTAAQWNNCFQTKQDVLGYAPLNRNGDTMVGRLVTAPPSSIGGFSLTPGTAPSAPVNGDLWATPSGIYGEVNGAPSWLSQPAGRLAFTVSVNFNTTGDTEIPLALSPGGSSRYLVNSVIISGASHTLATAAGGMFTASGGGGVAVVTAASPITVSSSTDATTDNTQLMTVNFPDTRSYTLAGQSSLFFRLATAEGTAATGNVTVIVTPLP